MIACMANSIIRAAYTLHHIIGRPLARLSETHQAMAAREIPSYFDLCFVTLGGNYGWRLFEGNQCTGLGSCVPPPANYVPPIFQYSLSGPRCAIIGGYVYRGFQGALPQGSYVYGDFCTGEIFLYNGDPGQQPLLLLDTTRSIVGFAEDEAGEIYVIGQGGTIEKIVAAGPFARPASPFDNVLIGSNESDDDRR